MNELIEKDKNLKKHLFTKNNARSSSRNTTDNIHQTNTILINNLKLTKLPFEKKIKEEKGVIVKNITDCKISIQFNSIANNLQSANIKKISQSLSKNKNIISNKKKNY